MTHPNRQLVVAALKVVVAGIPSFDDWEIWYFNTSHKEPYLGGVYLNEGYIDEDEEVLTQKTKSEYQELVSQYKKLPNSLVLYRAVCLDDLKDLDTNRIGVHWSLNENTAECYEQDGIEKQKPEYTIKAQVSKSDVWWDATILHNIKYGEEESEITIKPKAPVKIQSIKHQGKWFTPKKSKAKAALKSVVANSNLDKELYDLVLDHTSDLGIDNPELVAFAKEHPEYIAGLDKGMEHPYLYRSNNVLVQDFLAKYKAGESDSHRENVESWSTSYKVADGLYYPEVMANDTIKFIVKKKIPAADRIVCIPCEKDNPVYQIEEDRKEKEVICYPQSYTIKDIVSIQQVDNFQSQDDSKMYEVSLEQAVENIEKFLR